MTTMQIPRIISAALVVLRIACSQVYTRHLPAGGRRAKGDYSGRPNPPPTHPPKKGYHLVNWKKMVASVERGKSYQEQAVEGGMHHCPAVGSPTRTEKPQNPEIKSSRCCSRDLLENLFWGEGGGGREGGGEEAFLSLQWSLPPQWSWRAYTVELTQPRSHWRQPGTYCTALYHQPPFLINVQIVSSNQYYVEKSHTVCTLFPWDIASNTAIKNLFPELGDGVKSPKLLMFKLHILAFEAYNSLSWKMSTKIWILTFWVLNSCVFNTSLIVI